MHLDDRIAYIAGFIFTTASTMNTMGMIQAAAIGLIGGFFGLAGKELFYLVKSKIKRNNEADD